ncbi:MAG: hypothetical protein VXY16_01715 [Pseudomonadota bacterium]|nr:hypothetical protein [Pseudomonadota bacterium]
MMEFLSDTGSWVLISFLIFAFLAYTKGKAAFLNMLDSRIEAIKNEIETAESLRVEAQELLAQYQRKQRDAAKEAEEIVKTAKEHAEEIKKQADTDLKALTKKREEQLKERLSRMEEKAMREIQAYAAELAVNATKEIIAKQMDKKTNENLVKESIKNISKQVGTK